MVAGRGLIKLVATSDDQVFALVAASAQILRYSELRIMDDDVDHYRIRYPSPDGGDQILLELGLNGVPPKDILHDTIEKQWLTPKDQLPERWLNRYQV